MQSETLMIQGPMLSSTIRPHQYTEGDPVNNSDPSGMCCPLWQCLSNGGGNSPAESKYTARNRSQYGYCQTNCAAGLNGESWVLTSVYDLWYMLTPSDQRKQGAFDLMLNMVTENYQSDPNTKYHSECSGSSQSCISFLVPSDGSGDYYFQETNYNSINWWAMKLRIAPYISLLTPTEWLHNAETLPDPVVFVAVGHNVGCTSSTANGLLV